MDNLPLYKGMLCGFGSFARILRLDNGEEVIKVNRKQDDLLGIRYPAEYDITCRLNHPHILKALRLSEEGYLIFPYYPHTLCRDKILKLPFAQREKLVLQLISAVDYLHDAGYLHLDIKANNILVNKDGTHLVLADFGTSLFVGYEKGKSSSRDRLSDYLKSPELLQAKIKGKEEFFYTRHVDYWALGLLCLDVLTGQGEKIVKEDIRAMYSRKKFLFKLPESRKRYFKRVLPGKKKWHEYLDRLLEWNPKHRILPMLAFDTFISKQGEKLSGSWDESYHKELITSSFYQWIDTTGTERVEAFFLASDLYCRCWHLPFYNRDILLACYWIALKIVNGTSTDPREIDPDNNQVSVLWQIERAIIKELKGRLYYPNYYTDAQSRQELIVAWRYLYARPEVRKEKYLIRECPIKANLSMDQYAYALF